MKRKIKRNNKYILIGILIVFICITSYGVFFLIQYPGTKEQKISLYSYTHHTDVNYNVGLKRNSLYDNPVLGEGQVYLGPLVDTINATFTYRFQGEKEAEFKGDYEIVGIVEGYQGEKDNLKTLWTKRYVLQGKTSFTAKNSSFSLSKQIPVAYNSYRAFSESLAKDLSISFNAKLTVMMNVHIQAAAGNGSIEENLSPGLVIPLNTPYFEITKTQAGDKNGAIQQTQKTTNPVDWKKVYALGAIMGLALITLIYVVFFTSGIVIRNITERKLISIFKKYGSRMVALSSGIPVNSEHLYQVKFIDDLIKLSDETGRPIIYEHRENAQDITRLYVVDQDNYYFWNPWGDEQVYINNLSMNRGVNYSQPD